MRSRLFKLAFALSLLGLIACERDAPPPAHAPQTATEGAESESESRPHGTLPPTARIAEGRGPALYLGADVGSQGFGYLSPGVMVELAGELEASRILARVRGQMRVRGYIPIHRLELLALTRGRVRDTPIYLGAGDAVRLIGYGEEAGRVRVAATPTIVSREGANVNVPRYEGSFPAAALGGEAPIEGGGLPGRPVLIRADHALPIFDETGKERLLTLPPNHHFEAYEVRRDGDRVAVLLGSGPYLAGYLHHGEIIPDAEPRGEKSANTASARPETIPERIRRDESSGPLRRVRAGTRVVFDGVTIASVDAPAHAREMARYEETGEVDVFVAVDDDVAIRGMVPIDAVEDAP